MSKELHQPMLPLDLSDVRNIDFKNYEGYLFTTPDVRFMSPSEIYKPSDLSMYIDLRLLTLPDIFRDINTNYYQLNLDIQYGLLLSSEDSNPVTENSQTVVERNRNRLPLWLVSFENKFNEDIPGIIVIDYPYAKSDPNRVSFSTREVDIGINEENLIAVERELVRDSLGKPMFIERQYSTDDQQMLTKVVALTQHNDNTEGTFLVSVSHYDGFVFSNWDTSEVNLGSDFELFDLHQVKTAADEHFMAADEMIKALKN